MSVFRVFSRSERRVRRDSSSLPYSHTSRASRAPEKTSWNFPTFVNFLTSLGFGSKLEDDAVEDEEMCDEDVIQTPKVDVEMDKTENVATEATPAAKPAIVSSGVPAASIPPPPRAGNDIAPVAKTPSSPSEPLFGYSDESILKWGKRKVDSGSTFSEAEVLAITTFIVRRKKRSLNAEYKPEKVRFGSDEPSTSSDPCATTPSQQSAVSASNSLPTFTNTSAAGMSSAPKRMLKEDPNGPIIWRGAGSARVNTAQGRRRPAPSDFSKPDISKRRKIYEESSSSGTATSMSTSRSAPVSVSPGGVAGPSALPRFPRVNAVRPRTARLVFYPPRNVVSSSTPSSPPMTRRARTPATTAAANVNASTSANLSEVIEKATPRYKHPDVANPYQTAALVKPPYKPMAKIRMSELRARSRQAEKDKELARAKESQNKEPTAKDIIEATVPKGAKRSRPPPSLSKAKSVNGDVHATANNTINEESVEESTPRKKKRTVTVEEVFEDDDDVRSASSYTKPTVTVEAQGPAFVHARPPPTYVPGNHFGPPLNAKGSTLGKSSVPKEPSKLRTSFLPDDEENEIPIDSVPLKATLPSMTTSSAPLAEVQEKKSPKEIALSLPVSELPTFAFKAPSALSPADHSEARDAAKALPVSALPKFDFSKTHHLVNGVKSSSASNPPVKAFDFAAAGLKPATPPINGQWQCSSCMLQNPSSAAEKCTICDAPRSGVEKAMTNGTHPPANLSHAPVPVPAVKAFDFAAAGLKAPRPASDGKWQCSSCMLENPASASEKCTICDAPRPGAEKQPTKPCVSERTPPPPAAPKVFDWAAAGLAPKTKNSCESWTCGTCMLSNPASVTEKCKICDAPRS